MGKQIVFVARYEHKHGESTCVYSSKEKAEAWKEEIAKNWWTSKGFDGEPPAIGAGDEYFEAMSDRNEFFSVLELEIDP